MVLIAIFEPIFFNINYQVSLLLGITDVGGSMVLHGSLRRPLTKIQLSVRPLGLAPPRFFRIPEAHLREIMLPLITG